MCLNRKKSAPNIDREWDLLNKRIQKESKSENLELREDLLDAKKEIQKAQVIIDFSMPELSLQVAHLAEQLSIPLVIGTTGFSSKQTEKLKSYAKKIPMIVSANMSLGVNTLFYLVGEAAKILGNENFDIEIIETHHAKKKDSPSVQPLR